MKDQKVLDVQSLESRVRRMYTKVAENPTGEFHFEMGRSLAERLGYPTEDLDRIPAKAVESFAGVGYYFGLADIPSDATVVDFGSGSGMDVFAAALRLGDIGKVIGVDMTDAQLEKAGELGRLHGFDNVDFIKGYIESVPLANNSADVVISNGVINLSADKPKVFGEIARLLKPGGKLILADIVSGVKLPESIKCNAALWAACIGGAVPLEDYREMISQAGLDVIEVIENPYGFISKSAKGATDSYDIKSISLFAVNR